MLRRLALLGLSLGVAGFSVSLAGPPPPARISVVAAPTPAPVVVTPAPTPVAVFRPERIELPTLGVNAPIVSVGIDPDGAMGTPRTAHEVAWWDGVEIGAGNALLAGHRDWNRRPGSFNRIGAMKPGDPVRLTGPGGTLEFRVEWIKQVGANAPVAGILDEVGRPVVTLITCGGQFDRRVRHYQERIVVRAVLA